MFEIFPYCTNIPSGMAQTAHSPARLFRQDLTIRQYMLGDTPSRFLKVWLK